MAGKVSITKIMKPCRRHLTLAMLAICLLGVMVVVIGAQNAWDKVGCHRIGHTQNVSIPGCPDFAIFTNGCRGYCLSYAIPTTDEVLNMHKKTHKITSMGACCSMVEAEKISVSIVCIDGTRVLHFLTAKECGCSHCKKY